MIVFRRSVIAMIGGRGKGVGWAASFFEVPVERSSFDVHAVSFVWTGNFEIDIPSRWKMGKVWWCGKDFRMGKRRIPLRFYSSHLWIKFEKYSI